MAASKYDYINVDDFEKYALSSLTKSVADYYKSGANHEQTLKENRNAFQRLRIRPRYLVDVSNRNLCTYVLGKKVLSPIGIAPTAMQRMAHPDGELATARGASSEGSIMILSTLSTTSLEDVAESAPDLNRWMQLIIYKDRKATKDLVFRAEKAGYSAIVLTIDVPVLGQRWTDTRNRFSLPSHLRLANFDEADVQKSSVSSTSQTTSNLNVYADSMFDSSISWNDVLWLKEITTLPIILKGILTAEDAILAVQHQVAGIIVSNHGARQLDGVPATIEVLPEIVKAVDGRCEVYLDGGVCCGTDVFKALALGARAVFVGRPILWGLAKDGEQGVQKVLQILKKELDLALALIGCCSIEDIKSSTIVKQEYYSKF